MKGKITKAVSDDPMTRLWQASSVDIKKLTRTVMQYDVASLCRDIQHDSAKLNLPTQAKLLRGVVNIEYQQAHQQFSDAVDARTKLGVLEASATDENVLLNVPASKKDKKTASSDAFKLADFVDEGQRADVAAGAAQVSELQQGGVSGTSTVELEVVDEDLVLKAAARLAERSARQPDTGSKEDGVLVGPPVDMQEQLWFGDVVVDLDQELSTIDFSLSQAQLPEQPQATFDSKGVIQDIPDDQPDFAGFTSMYVDPFADTSLVSLQEEKTQADRHNNNNNDDDLIIEKVVKRKQTRIDRTTQLSDELIDSWQKTPRVFSTGDNGKRRRLCRADIPFQHFQDMLGEQSLGQEIFEKRGSVLPIPLQERWKQFCQERLDRQLDTDALKIEEIREHDPSTVEFRPLDLQSSYVAGQEHVDQQEQSLDMIDSYVDDHRVVDYSNTIDLERYSAPITESNDLELNELTRQWYTHVKRALNSRQDITINTLVNMTTNSHPSRLEHIHAFTSILVLATEGALRIQQPYPYQPIYISRGPKYV